MVHMFTSHHFFQTVRDQVWDYRDPLQSFPFIYEKSIPPSRLLPAAMNEWGVFSAYLSILLQWGILEYKFAKLQAVGTAHLHSLSVLGRSRRGQGWRGLRFDYETSHVKATESPPEMEWKTLTRRGSGEINRVKCPQCATVWT